jgi:hypothetical protein
MNWQSKVTAVVKDSSDDLWFLESDSDDDLFSHVFANEYEPDNRYTVDGRSSDSEDDAVSSSQEVLAWCMVYDALAYGPSFEYSFPVGGG